MAARATCRDKQPRRRPRPGHQPHRQKIQPPRRLNQPPQPTPATSHQLPQQSIELHHPLRRKIAFPQHVIRQLRRRPLGNIPLIAEIMQQPPILRKHRHNKQQVPEHRPVPPVIHHPLHTPPTLRNASPQPPNRPRIRPLTLQKPTVPPNDLRLRIPCHRHKRPVHRNHRMIWQRRIGQHHRRLTRHHCGNQPLRDWVGHF